MAAQSRPAVPVSVASFGVAIMVAEWLLLVATTKPHEMIVGALAVVASGTFLWHAHRCEPLRLRFRLRDVLSLWRLPWDVLSDCWRVTRLLISDLTGHRVGSFYRVCGFATAKDDPELAARRVLATLAATTSPNMIVIGVDYHQSRMLFHQVERARIPTMLEGFGAKP